VSKRCCKYHDNFFEAWIDANVEQPTDLDECGMAGPGAVTLCCASCPLIVWYKKNQPTRPVQYIKDIIAEVAAEEQS
jgi:hypothetical protein